MCWLEKDKMISQKKSNSLKDKNFIQIKCKLGKQKKSR